MGSRTGLLVRGTGMLVYRLVHDEGHAGPMDAAQSRASPTAAPPLSLGASRGETLLEQGILVCGFEPMPFGSAAWRCALQTLHAVVSERGSESGLGKRVPEILQPAQENSPVVTEPPTRAVGMARQASPHAFIPHVHSIP
jgi:hypothetical protein